MRFNISLLFRLPILFTLFSLLSSNLNAQEPSIDIQHYHFALALSDASDEIIGKSDIDILFTKTTQSFSLDLVSEQEGKGMKVTSVKMDESEVTFSQKGEKLSIQLGKSVLASSTHSFEITYRGVPADGLIISKNKHGDRTFFGDNWPNRAHHWLPMVDHPADKATCEFIVTAPEHYEVIATGLKVEESHLADGLKRTHWRSSVILPTKVMVIGAARFAIQHVGTYEGIPVTSWVYPQDREAGFHDYALALPVLKFMTTHIGPYPYVKLANVQSKTRYGGMENASNIFYAENSVTGDRSSERLIAHEVAHQWFGNSASEEEWFHIWLSEGFATYFTHLYIEHTYGREEMLKGLLRDRNTVLSFHERVPNAPIVDTTITDLNYLLSPNSYQKGSWVLHMLRGVVGDDAFWKGIQTYYDRYKLSNALTEDLQAVMEEVSGMKLDWFFQEWIYQPGQPEYAGTWTYDKKEKALVVEIEQVQAENLFFHMPLEIGVFGKKGEEPMVTSMLINDRKVSFRIPLDEKPTKVVIDPNIWVLSKGKEMVEE